VKLFSEFFQDDPKNAPAMGSFHVLLDLGSEEHRDQSQRVVLKAQVAMIKGGRPPEMKMILKSDPRKFLSVFFCITALGFSIRASAKDEKSSQLLTTVLENIHEKENVLHMLAAAGASLESLGVISKDLDKRMPKGTKIPQLSLKNDEIQIAGKRTGLIIVSYEPFKITIEKRTWTVNPDKTADVNYLDLTRFIETKPKSAAMARLLLPQALAQFGSLYSGALSGALIGAVAGGCIGVATGNDPLSSAIAGGGLGMVFGGAAGAINQNNQSYAPCGRNILGAPLACPYQYQYQYPYAPPAPYILPATVR
jgi:hypothetical protein